MRTALYRLALVPLAVVLAHFFGFAFAHVTVPLHAARNPMYASGEEPEALLPAYSAYLARAAQRDLGTLPGPSHDVPLGQAVAAAALRSLGLAALALALSVALGFTLGLRAVRAEPPRVAPWLTVTASVGLAMPGVFMGSLVITAIFI